MEEKKELIVVKQLPVIEEQLRSLSDEIDKKVSRALSLVVSDETVKEVKKVRAELNADFKDLEQKRKSVKEQVMNPYLQFEEIYKKYVTEKFKYADEELKKKISMVETEQLNAKSKEIKDYFEEYKVSKNIDFITFENANINITLSASNKSLKEQAKEFIDNYFEQYPQIKDYMDKAVQEARDKGYAETIMHRRRYLPDIHAKKYTVRAFAERTAINSPIQGSAADIIKIAMINMQKKLDELHLKTKMVVQVHDELIFDVPKDELETIKKIVPEVMQSAVKLDVPLIADSGWGHNWYDAK